MQLQALCWRGSESSMLWLYLRQSTNRHYGITHGIAHCLLPAVVRWSAGESWSRYGELLNLSRQHFDNDPVKPSSTPRS